jgi:hypothetical protein
VTDAGQPPTPLPLSWLTPLLVCCPFVQTIHCLYIFNGKGACLYYREWNRPHSTLADNPSEDRKLLFGLHFSLKKLIEKMSPTP